MKHAVILLITTVTVLAIDESTIQDFVKANNLFAASVYKDLTKVKTKNFLVSPYSAEAVLALTQSGCKGDTAREIRNALYLPDDKDKTETSVKASIAALTGNELYTLNTANKVYVKEGFSIKDDFKKSAVEVYGADVESINFTKNVESAEKINNWVEEKTNHKIKNLIDSKVLDELTRIILVNALHFKSNWSNQFVEYATHKDNFFRTAEETVKVDVMRQYEKYYNYYESSELNAKFLELPFKGGEASMVIALPNDKDGLVVLESQIDKVLTHQNFNRELLNIVLPKFKIESTIDFTDILKNFGVDKAFRAEYADLSGIAGKPGDLIISDVLQKTFIDVQEGGVEAAAATYVEIALASAPLAKPEPKNFVADHPFIFYIKAKNIIIFAGRLIDPSV